MVDGIDVAGTDEIEPGSALPLDTSLTGTPEPISIFRDTDGTFYALDDTCTHERQSLADGWVEDCQVECPLHAACFSLRTGAALTLPATKPLQTHRLEVQGDRLVLFPGEPAVID